MCGSGVLVEPSDIDAQFRKVWLPSFCMEDPGSADVGSFGATAVELNPLLDEVELLALTVDFLFDAVEEKDAWGWREFKALPATWFDRLAAIFTRVEEDGVWPEGFGMPMLLCFLRLTGT